MIGWPDNVIVATLHLSNVTQFQPKTNVIVFLYICYLFCFYTYVCSSLLTLNHSRYTMQMKYSLKKMTSLPNEILACCMDGIQGPSEQLTYGR